MTVTAARTALRQARVAAAAPAAPAAPAAAPGAPPPAPPLGAPPPAGAPAQQVDVVTGAAEVEQAKAAATDGYLKNLGRWTWWITAALLVAGLLGSMTKPKDTSAWFHSALGQAIMAAIALWAVLFAVSLLKRGSGRLVHILIGQDGRLSTSYFQAWIWTLVLVWAFLYFVAALIVSGVDQLSTITNDLGADYLLLLGGPFVALISAQQIGAAKRDNQTLSKVSTAATTPNDLISDDRGRADLVDMQYLLFNVVALAFFFAVFARDHGKLPDLPDGLVALTSAAALAYIAKKAVASNAPGITSIVRVNGVGPVCVGDTVLISGFNFIPAGGEAEEYLSRVRVRFGITETAVAPAGGGTPAQTADDLNVAVTNITSTEIRVKVPDMTLTARQQVPVVVVTAAGVETEPYQLTVLPHDLPVHLPATLTPGQKAELILPGLPPGTVARVSIGGVDQDVVVGAAGSATVVVPRLATAPSAEVTITALGLTATRTVAVAGEPELIAVEVDQPQLILRGVFPVGQGTWTLLVDGVEVALPPPSITEDAIVVSTATVPKAVRSGARRIALLDPDRRASRSHQVNLGS